MFSDWRGKPRADWSTNVPVCDYYTGSHSNSLREPQWEQFKTELQSGDTLIIGVDFYGLNMSFTLLPLQFLRDNAKRLLDGEVIYLIAYGKGDDIFYGVLS